MARKRHHEEHVNHEAWAIPYGDLITLLLAFFVVMYALSTINEGKYRVLSDSLIAAFRAPPKSLEPVQVGELSRAFHEVQADRSRTLVPLEIESFNGDDPETDGRGEEPGWQMLRGRGISPAELGAAGELIEELHSSISSELELLVTEDLVRLRPAPFWLEIEINTSLLFDTASAEMALAWQPVVHRLGEILAPTATRIQVEGHTDVRPISTAVFPSNWELSSARAASVVRMLAGAGVEPGRMAAVGFGEFQPVAASDTPQGLAENRRVIIVVMAGREWTPDDTWLPGEQRPRRHQEVLLTRDQQKES